MPYKSGLVAMLGKPNVGKSTLVNALVGHKVSIVSNKPQTTRRKVLGVAQGEEYQVAFIDTPGIHEPHTTLARTMVESARQALHGVDVIVYVVDSSHRPDQTDTQISNLVRPGGEPIAPVVVCLNKMDVLRAELVQAQVDAYTALFKTQDYMLTTATRGHNVDKLMAMILEKVPEGEPMFPEDEYTDQPLRFMVSELIREKVLQKTRQEVPHATAVVVDEWEDTPTLVSIRATIVVEKQGQKAIVIGERGSFLKEIGTEARIETELLLGKKVFLELYVKVREDWRMNPRLLQELEYTD
jgi:GTP-binding protein Era